MNQKYQGFDIRLYVMTIYDDNCLLKNPTKVMDSSKLRPFQLKIIFLNLFQQ